MRAILGGKLMGLCVAGAAFAIIAYVCGLIQVANAQTAYPNKPIRLVVPSAAGGATDIAGRVVAEGLQTLLGQKIIVENRLGAGGITGGQSVVQSPADGYTLLFANTSTQAINPALFPKMPYDPVKDLTAIVWLSLTAEILVVNPKRTPVASVDELVQLLKKDPASNAFASGGLGTLPHLAFELFKHESGITTKHVPYGGGGAASLAIINGEATAMFEVPSLVQRYMQSGDMKPLAVTTPERIAELRDIPTMIEAGYPNVAVLSFTGLMAPANTPPSIVQFLNQRANQLLQQPEFRKRLADLGLTAKGGAAGDFLEYMAKDREKWTRVVRDANIRIE